MMTRRTALTLPAALLLAGVGGSAAAARKRALVIGINAYVMPPEDPPSGSGISDSVSPKRLRGNFAPLDGAVNDALLMRQILRDRFDFAAGDIKLLTDREATRERILREFQAWLIDAPAAGDTSLFYYAGHGSQVKNLGSEEVDQFDETIVPVDVCEGARDIRDKEMARLYRAVVQKGVGLTVILDSCHSGGMSRGVWNAGGKSRFMPPDSRPVNDPPDRDPKTGARLPDAASLGALFLFAARDDQAAQEGRLIERGSTGEQIETPHGAFTLALGQVMRSPAAGDSVEQICSRVQSILASEAQIQVPICAGRDRSQRGLLGQDAGAGSAIRLAVLKVDESQTIHLQGGSALGLAVGCTLSRTNGPPVRIALTGVDLASCEGKVANGDGRSPVEPGDVFKLETWVAPANGELKVFLDKSGPSGDQIMAVARNVGALEGQGVEVLQELTRDKPPTQVLHWDHGEYVLESVPAGKAPTRLGASPSSTDLARALRGPAPKTLWVMLPPSPDLAAKIRLGAASENPVVRVVDRPADATYLLTGRLQGGELQYSWVFKDALGTVSQAARLPARTDWKNSGQSLTDLALSLARIYLWLSVENPPAAGSAFPYHLGFVKAGSRQLVKSPEFKIGERYKLVFSADAGALQEAARGGGSIESRYVYVFIIDSDGQATCLFPEPADGNEKNRLPRGDIPASLIEATRYPYDLDIKPPAGRDNYFLVSSRDALDPGIFEWKGVHTQSSARRGTENGLEFLFSSMAEGRRGAGVSHPVPVSWSVDSMTIQSNF